MRVLKYIYTCFAIGLIVFAMTSCSKTDSTLLIDRTGIEKEVSPNSYFLISSASFNAIINGREIAGVYKNNYSNDVFYHTSDDFFNYSTFPFADKIDFDDSGKFQVQFGKIHYWNRKSLVLGFWSNKTPEIKRSVVGLAESYDNGHKWYVKAVAFLDSTWRHAAFQDAALTDFSNGWVVVSKGINQPDEDLVLFKIKDDSVLVPFKTFSGFGSYKAMSRVDANTAWLIAANAYGSNKTVNLFLTTDGGQSWCSREISTDITRKYALNGYNTQQASWISLTGSNAAMYLYKTNDGCSPSTPQSLRTPISENNTTLTIPYYCVNSNVAYIIRNDAYTSTFYKTTDGGNTWSPVFTDTLQVRFTNLCFSDENNGIAFGYSQRHAAYSNLVMYRTADGGRYWDLIIYPYPYVLK